MNWSNTIRQEFEQRVFQESYPRIEKCLNTITDEQLWSAPNENMVSIGCLIKHLLGNAQQWVYQGVLGNAYQRNRDAEFDPEITVSKDDLLKKMKAVEVEMAAALKSLSEEQLEQNLVIQGFETTGVSAIVHVIEHFSYHTGQISLLTKMFQNVDLDYYGNYDLDV